MGSSETMTTVALAIEGMHCKSCVLLIEETLDRDPAVHAVTVDLDSARAEVTFNEESTSVEAVCSTIADLGYPATLAGDPDS
jgi:copper chaperone CopZ